MTTFTPILHAPQVASNQNQKEATINTALAVLEAAMNDRQTISLAGGNHTLSTDEFTKVFHTTYSGHTAARVVTIPATVRFFAASNTGTANITFHCTGSAGADLIVPADKRVLVISDGTNVVAISQGVSQLSDLTDVVGALDASAGQILAFAAGVWGPIDNARDHSFYFDGQPTAAKRLYRHVFVRAATLFSDFNGSRGTSDVPPLTNQTLDVFKNGTLVGYISYAAGNGVPTYSTNLGAGSAPVTFNPGDVLTVDASAYPDANHAGMAVTLKGVFT